MIASFGHMNWRLINKSYPNSQDTNIVRIMIASFGHASKEIMEIYMYFTARG